MSEVFEDLEQEVVELIKQAENGMTRPEIASELSSYSEVEISRTLSKLRDAKTITTAGLRHGFPIYFHGTSQPKAIAPQQRVAIGADMSVAARVLTALEQHGPMSGPALRGYVDVHYLDVTLSKMSLGKKIQRVGFKGSFVYGLLSHTAADMQQALNGRKVAPDVPPALKAGATRGVFGLTVEGHLLHHGVRLLSKPDLLELLKFIHQEQERMWPICH